MTATRSPIKWTEGMEEDLYDLWEKNSNLESIRATFNDIWETNLSKNAIKIKLQRLRGMK